MKKVVGIIVSLVCLLSACSVGNAPQSEITALALPGAPRSSWNTSHTSVGTLENALPGHRATVVAKKKTSYRTLYNPVYQPDSYIPVDSRFEVNLHSDHQRNSIWVTVSSNSSQKNPISCTWQLLSYQIINCSPSSTLSYYTLYTITVYEITPRGDLAVTNKAYFHTQMPPIFQP